MRIIWQYWETKGVKPAFIEGLHEIARRNSGCQVVLVTPQTLTDYLPDVSRHILRIQEMAHKADMIRSMLVALHGGMWLDSDAIVLRDLNWLFDLLEQSEFVGFNNKGRLEANRPWVRVNCFLSRAGGTVICRWVSRQHSKFPRTKFGWEEIGTEILHPLCLAHRERVKILPFESICPIPWDRVDKFERKHEDTERILNGSTIVMLSNSQLETRAPALRYLTCGQIAEADHLLGAVMRFALRGRSVDHPLMPTLRQGAQAFLAGFRYHR
jgi:hypothetical protein